MAAAPSADYQTMGPSASSASRTLVSDCWDRLGGPHSEFYRRRTGRGCRFRCLGICWFSSLRQSVALFFAGNFENFHNMKAHQKLDQGRLWILNLLVVLGHRFFANKTAAPSGNLASVRYASGCYWIHRSPTSPVPREAQDHGHLAFSDHSAISLLWLSWRHPRRHFHRNHLGPCITICIFHHRYLWFPFSSYPLIPPGLLSIVTYPLLITISSDPDPLIYVTDSVPPRHQGL